MTPEVLNEIKRKRRAWTRYLVTKRNIDLLEYKRVRNEVNDTVKKAKIDYEKSIALNAKKEPKRFWKYVKQKTKSKSSIGNLLKTDGTSTETDSEKADELNSVFASVFTRENLSNIPIVQDLNFDRPLETIDVSINQVEKLLHELNTTKSMGPDNMHPFLLQKLSKTLCYPLTAIFQKSVSVGKIPKEWKYAKVTPLFKKGNKSVTGNYRPVSLTSVVCKCLERIIRAQIVEHLERNHLLSDSQYGFRSGRSCVLQLFDVLEDWSLYVEENKSWDTVYLDLAKAFDKVSHQRLFKKVSSNGIKGSLLKWIESFLTDRQQYVTVKGRSSNWKDVLSGVCQGSVLGPLLFLLYVNDFPDVIKSMLKLFADDAKIYQTTDKCDILQDDLSEGGSWADKWELKFHVDKCGVMHYGRTNENLSYKMNSKTLKVVNEERDLGIIFQDDLKFNKNISIKVQKANIMLRLIIRSFDYLDKNSYIRLYKVMIRSQLEMLFGILICAKTLIVSKLYRKDLQN